MAYVLPKVRIQQEFTQTPIFATSPLSAFVFGPQYNLVRYAVADEKTLAYAGVYEGEEVSFSYPNQALNSRIDEAYTKVHLEKAEAQYFPHADLGSASDVVTVVANYRNRIRSSALVFKTGNGTDRSSVFSNRDVKVGDVVYLNDGTNTLKTKVKGFVAEVVAAEVESPGVNYAANRSQVEDFNNLPVWAGDDTDPEVDFVSSSANYFGYPGDNVYSDVYTFEVTTGGATLANLRFTVSSASGAVATVENVALVSDELILDNSDGNDIAIDFDGISRTWVVGEKWTVSVAARSTLVTPVTTGTFVGTSDITYTLTVVRGGPFYDGDNADVCARVAITSNNVDSSPTVNVAADTYFTVGSYGVQAKFATGSIDTDGDVATGLGTGDQYSIEATASTAGAYKTLELADDLSTELLESVEDIVIDLLLVTDVEVTKVRDYIEDTLNWLSEEEEVTLYESLSINDPLLVALGEEVDLPVVYGKVYVTHRELMKVNTTAIASLNTVDEVAPALGTVHPDNPLAQGVYDAVLNSSNATVYYVGIPTNDTAGYNKALGLAKNSDKVYSLVPLTYDSTVKDAVVSHVNALSTPDNAKWRICWLATQLVESALIYDLKTDDTNWTATVDDDPSSSGTHYNRVYIAGATLLTDGVRTGDILKINFRLNASGEVISDEYVIDEVQTETTLTLASDLPAAVVLATKVQIERTYTEDEQIDNLAVVAGDYDNRRVRNVFPDTFKSGTVEKEGFYLAAALAGLRSGVVPHQGLTNIQVLGPTDLTKTVSTFDADQLDRLAEQGVWIVTQDAVGATPYTRHQLTTDEAGLNFAEDSITTNVDSISYGLQRVLAPFIGIYNRNTYAILLIKDAIAKELDFRAVNTFTATAGNQLNGYTINSITENATFKDRVDVDITLDVPAPINSINVKLTV